MSGLQEWLSAFCESMTPHNTTPRQVSLLIDLHKTNDLQPPADLLARAEAAGLIIKKD